MIEKYYEEELRYLIDSGKEFARAHPDRGRFLNIDAIGDRDPYVERLFEGFAFLAARIREKIDDSFPELTEGLLDLLWPQLLEEIPSLSITEFIPRKAFLQETRVIERGAEILSNSVGPEACMCRFTTTQNVYMHPLELRRVTHEVNRRNQATLHFNFIINPGAQWENMKLEPLQLYLHAEIPTALMLHQFLTRKVIKASVKLNTLPDPVEIAPQQATSPGGMSPDEALLAGDSRSFWGYALLREYFVFPEKFMFVDLNRISTIPTPAEPPTEFTCSLTFDAEFPHDYPFGQENFRLYCTPVANISSTEAEPIIHDGLDSEYRVIADSSYPESAKTHSVIGVVGIDRSTGERQVYQPFHTFKHISGPSSRCYTSNYRITPDGRRHCFIRLGGDKLEEGQLREESLSVRIRLTNGELPRDEIQEGGINKPGSGFPDYVAVRNITRPTLPKLPPGDSDFMWKFLAHLASTYTTLADADTFKSVLKLYDWSGSEGRSRRIDAIAHIEALAVSKACMGSIVHGVRFTVTIQEAHFSDTGDLHLFGQVLKEFLAHYISINSFVELIMVLKPSGKAQRWDSLEGKQWLI
ncbi:MAG: type VI secretion system baseplate subunit TssF [Chitinivibrionales bacterium]|nr:type VI secretion system baseplate subunit TssF [Chitinivibrionales bacterium]